MKALRSAAAGCRGCDLYAHATQTVFGEGPVRAKLMLVGEQPGDSEDRAGHPFVGPAGRVLHEALQRAGIDETAVYVTNAVKHFRFVVRGKRRIHAKPRVIEIDACKPWLDAEIALVKPAVVVPLGATAAFALMGRNFKLTPNRGRAFDYGDAKGAMHLVATVHPSSILRAPDGETRRAEMTRFVGDLRKAAAALQR